MAYLINYFLLRILNRGQANEASNDHLHGGLTIYNAGRL